MADITEKELLALYRSRIKDRSQSRTKRRRQLENAPQTVGTLLQSYFQADSQALRRIEESRATQAWETLVGPAASRFSQALKLRGNTLIVRVSDALWMQQLSLLKHELLRKYRTLFPRLGLKDIYFTCRQ